MIRSTLRLRAVGRPAAVAAAGATLFLPLFVPRPAHADSFRYEEAKFFSRTGNNLFLTAGTFLPLATDGSMGRSRATRNVDLMLTTMLVTQGLKHVVHEERPDGSSDDSFPSGHTTAAFAIATMNAHDHPRDALLWFAGASLIAESRVYLRRHRWKDVIAGAALGIGLATLAKHQPRGILMRDDDQPHRAAGIGFQFRLGR